MNQSEKNQNRYWELLESSLDSLRGNIVPGFITFLMMTKKMAKEFGYENVMDFLREDDEKLNELLESFDEDKLNRLNALYETMEHHAEGCMKLCDDVGQNIKEAENLEQLIHEVNPEWGDGG